MCGFLRGTFYRQTCHEVPAVASFRQKKEKNVFPTEASDHFWLFLWPVVFSSIAPILGPVKIILTMSPSFKLTARGGEYDIRMYKNRIDCAGGIYEGGDFRMLVSTTRPTHEK